MQIQTNFLTKDDSKIILEKLENTKTTTNLITSTAQSKICAKCNKSPTQNICGRCKVIRYCSRDCQSKDWQKHKEICQSPVSLNVKKEVKSKLNGLEYEPLLESVINKVLNSQPALDLLEKVLMDGPLNIRFGEAPMGAKWEPQIRCITISSSESDFRKLGHIIFEIANATHCKAQITLANEAQKGIVSREQYAERWEKIEYSALVIFIPVIDASIEKYKWPIESYLDLNQLIKICNTWDRFWDFISKSSHSELFRVEWDKKFRSIYEKKI